VSQVPTDLSSERIVRALKKAGYELSREGKHISMIKGEQIVIIPRHKRIKRETLRGIIQDAGLSVKEFRSLL
jgi:predicted RNA binding protein YcfA (HicA-like mRNA interferase family)